MIGCELGCKGFAGAAGLLSVGILVDGCLGQVCDRVGGELADDLCGGFDPGDGADCLACVVRGAGWGRLRRGCSALRHAQGIAGSNGATRDHGSSDIDRPRRQRSDCPARHRECPPQPAHCGIPMEFADLRRCGLRRVDSPCCDMTLPGELPGPVWHRGRLDTVFTAPASASACPLSVGRRDAPGRGDVRADQDQHAAHQL